MSPRSGRQKIAQGEVSAANETQGVVISIVQSPQRAKDSVVR